MVAVDPSLAPPESISFRELFQFLWRGKWLIIGITAVCTILAGVAAWVTPKKYEATIVVSPVSSSANQLGGALSSFASQLGGLASLAGLNMTGDSKKAESLAVLQSEALTGRYIKDNGLLQILYADVWDSAQSRWKETDPKRVPTLWKANRFFGESVRKVKTETQTGLVEVTVRWTDPQLAADWANGLVAMTNEYLRAKAIAESEANIEYLKKEAERTEMVGAKQAIYAILQNEVNKAMLARGSAEYAFKIIDPAVTPEVASSPLKILWLAAGLFGGAVLSIFIVFLRAMWL